MIISERLLNMLSMAYNKFSNDFYTSDRRWPLSDAIEIVASFPGWYSIKPQQSQLKDH